jgi:pimeloyl-ACP methyl ester carboxylesterase
MSEANPTIIGAVALSIDAAWSVRPLERAPTLEAADRAAAADAAGEQAILDALERAGMAVVQALEVDAPQQESAAGRAESASLTVSRRADERVAMLIDQDGYLRWVIEAVPEDGGNQEATDPTAEVTATLQLPLTLRAPAGGAQPEVEGGEKNWVKRLKAWVLRMSARLVGKPVAQKLVAKMEMERRTGLVHLRAPWPTPESWRFVTTMADVTGLPTDRAPRILLLVHGTFVNLDGSYALLPATVPGRALLRTLIGGKDPATGEPYYDAVVGYDHLTLSATPLENALDLVDLLQTRTWPHAPVFDVVTTSRGSLVARCLIERVVPRMGRPPGWTFRKVVMIGPANGGSELARFDNWRDLLDQLTNLTKATAKTAAFLAPGAAGVLKGVSSVVVGVAWLVKALVYAAIEDGHVPGLAALDPSGRFIKDVNNQPLPDGLPERVPYHRVTSDFEWEADAELPYLGDDRNLRVRALLAAADKAVDKLFKDQPNDLVNDCPSAHVGHPALQSWFDAGERLHYGPNRWIHHLNHFLQPLTLAAIARWLGVRVVDANEAAPPAAGDAAVAQPLDVLAQERDALGDELARDLAALGGPGALAGALDSGPVPHARRTVASVPLELLTDLDPTALIEAWRRDEAGTRAFLDSYLDPKEALDFQLDLEELSRQGPSTEGLLDRYEGPDIIFLPGLPGTHLATNRGHGWRPWLNPLQFGRGDLAEALRLAEDGVSPAGDAPALSEAGSMGTAYNPAFLRWRMAGIRVHDNGFDWRKPLALAARELGERIDALRRESPGRRLALVGHSTGAFVAALWAARDPAWYEKVESAVFVGGALGGTFASFEVLSGQHELLRTLAAVTVNDDLDQLHATAVSWPGLIDLLPARGLLRRPGADLFDPGVWTTAHAPARRWLLQSARLKAEVLASPLLAVSTAIVRADIGTVEEVLQVGTSLRAGSPRGPGDGTIPIDLAVVPGLSQVYVSDVGSHSSMPAKGKVANAIRDLLETGRTDRLKRSSIDELRTAPAVSAAPSPELAGGGRMDAEARQRLVDGTYTAADLRRLVDLGGGGAED